MKESGDARQVDQAALSGSGSEEEEHALWTKLRAGEVSARADLVHRHLPHARRVAATYYRRRMHDEVEFDDYLQLAILGMMESIDRFEPALGVRFRTFSGRRMHGAILDGIERMTEKQQQIAARRRTQKERLASLIDAGLGFDPNRGLNAPKALPTETLFRYLADVGVGLALSFMLEGTGMLDPGETQSNFPGRSDAAYYRRAELRQLREKLLSHVEALKPQARQVIICHYVQAIPFDAIAKEMGLTKGRVSQIHREALLLLRNELRVERSSDLLC